MSLGAKAPYGRATVRETVTDKVLLLNLLCPHMIQWRRTGSGCRPGSSLGFCSGVGTPAHASDFNHVFIFGPRGKTKYCQYVTIVDRNFSLLNWFVYLFLGKMYFFFIIRQKHLKVKAASKIRQTIFIYTFLLAIFNLHACNMKLFFFFLHYECLLFPQAEEKRVWV